VTAIERPRLHPDSLAALPAAVARPTYRRAQLRHGIVHLGLGAFARAHLAEVTEQAVQHWNDLRWGIVGVSMRQGDTRDALAPQQGLYTLALRDAGPDGAARQRLRVIGCVVELLVAPEDPQTVVERISHADTCIVSLTITEKGYADVGPGSAVDLIVRGLAMRRARGRAGLTLLSLDNLPGNGRQLAAKVQALAACTDAALLGWIDANCSFPNSMVDRIVPRTTPADIETVDAALGLHDAWPVVGEPFFDWAVEDRFVAGRPAWDRGVVRVVADAAPWEQVKLRLVNGAHSQIAYLGAMAGWSTVDAAIAHPELASHIGALLRDELEPTLPPLDGWDRGVYRAALMARWRNPALAHRCQQIAMDGSQKIPQRWIRPLAERIAAGQPIRRLALGVAAWLHYLRGVDEAGHAYPIDDPMAATLRELLESASHADGRIERLRILTGLVPVFGELAGHPVLIEAVAPAWQALRDQGVAATLAALARA
jgi:fructuronate reductase